MIDVIASNLTAIVAIAISPMPLVGLVFLLITRSRGAALVWTLSWVSAVFVGTGLSALAGGSQAGEAATGSDGVQGVNWVAWVLAILFLYLSFSSFRKMPKKGETPTEPGWVTSLSKANILLVFGIGFLILFLNAKNTPLYISMGASIASQGMTPFNELITVIIISVLSSATAVGITVFAYAMGEKADATLERMRHWLIQYNALVMGLLFLLLGVGQLSTAIQSLPQ